MAVIPVVRCTMSIRSAHFVVAATRHQGAVLLGHSQTASSSSPTSSCVVLSLARNPRILNSMPKRSKIIATGPPMPSEQPGLSLEAWVQRHSVHRDLARSTGAWFVESLTNRMGMPTLNGSAMHGSAWIAAIIIIIIIICFWGSCRCAGLLDYEREEALSLGELPLRGAARLQKGRCCFWGISRCAELLDYRKEDAVSRGSPAARGCWITERKMLLLGDLPLRGAARLRKGDAASGGAPAALGCWIRERDMLFLGELPLRGAAGLQMKDAASGGSPAARGCWITERKLLFLGDLPLRGAAGLEKGICCF